MTGVNFHYQRNDSDVGVIVDGLDSMFTQNYVHTLQAVLKALGNRKYMYFISSRQEYNELVEERQRLQKEEGEKACHLTL